MPRHNVTSLHSECQSGKRAAKARGTQRACVPTGQSLCQFDPGVGPLQCSGVNS